MVHVVLRLESQVCDRMLEGRRESVLEKASAEV